MQEHVLHITEAASLPFVKKNCFLKVVQIRKLGECKYIYIYTFLSSEYVYHEEHLYKILLRTLCI